MFVEEENKECCGKPALMDLRKETLSNQCFRKELWTGEHLQLTVMSIPVGGEIGLEMHEDVDQLLVVESGCALVYTGCSKRTLQLKGKVHYGCAILIPAGTWHNVFNAYACPLKMYSVYAPPQHPVGTIHETKLQSDTSEE